MNLTIVSSEEKKIIQVSWIEINTSAGNFVIQPGYTPAVFLLAPHQPVTVCLTNGKQETFTISSGLLEIKRNAALLLIDQ